MFVLTIKVCSKSAAGDDEEFGAVIRIDARNEAVCCQHGGIFARFLEQFVTRFVIVRRDGKMPSFQSASPQAPASALSAE